MAAAVRQANINEQQYEVVSQSSSRVVKQSSTRPFSEAGRQVRPDKTKSVNVLREASRRVEDTLGCYRMERFECAAQLCYNLVGGRQLFYTYIHIHTIYAYAAIYLSLSLLLVSLFAAG